MGKSTTAGLFADRGVPVWDADRVVHDLYAPGGAGVAAIAQLLPQAAVAGRVDRAVLRSAIVEDDSVRLAVAAAIHPLVAANRAAFLAGNGGIVLCDVPLLFETGGDRWCDKTVVVTAPEAVQRARVLARPGMPGAAFAAILARQMPDAEKRRRADYVIDTSLGLDAARSAVDDILNDIQGADDA